MTRTLGIFDIFPKKTIIFGRFFKRLHSNLYSGGTIFGRFHSELYSGGSVFGRFSRIPVPAERSQNPVDDFGKIFL